MVFQSYLKIITKVYNEKINYTQYEKIIELLEYLSPRTLIELEEILIQNKKKIQELNKGIQRLQ